MLAGIHPLLGTIFDNARGRDGRSSRIPGGKPKPSDDALGCDRLPEVDLFVVIINVFCRVIRVLS